MSQICGPGFRTPLDAIRNGAREGLLYVICIQLDPTKPDYLATIDINPESRTYCKVIHRLKMPSVRDELHHMGWNICSSCHGAGDKTRDKLVLPCLSSNRIYVIDTSDIRAPRLHKVVEGESLLDLDVSTPHTAHCLPNGTVLISTMGDRDGNSKGDMVVLDSDAWQVTGLWTDGKRAKHGYDFWYQPFHDVLIGTEFSVPKIWLKGCDIAAIQDPDLTGSSLNVYSWKDHKLVQTIDLGRDGITPLELRFLHDPKADQGFVGCAFSSTVFRVYRNAEGTWSADKVIDVPPIKVSGWILPELPSMVTDILISMDDRWLYVTNWLQGDLRQYDISNPASPKLVSRVYTGGVLVKGSSVQAEEPNQELREPVRVKGVKIEGGPQMIQLSLDGKRLYVTNSLYSVWDRQFYPELTKRGSALLKIDVNPVAGGMKLDQDFIVDFGQEPDGPVLAHECRYPGGDCSSDIFLAQD